MWEIICEYISTSRCFHSEYMPNCNSRESVMATSDYEELKAWVDGNNNDDTRIVVKFVPQRITQGFNPYSSAAIGYND